MSRSRGRNSWKKRKGGGSADDPFDEKRRTDLSGAPIREGQFEPHAHLLLGGEGDHHHLDYSEENPIIGTGRLLSYPGEKAYSPPRRHHFTHSTRSEGGADFGESLYETELKGGAPSDGKRLRAQGEDSAPLAQLKKLYLQVNQIGDAGYIALADAFGKGALAQLEKLSLDRNQIGDAGCTALADAFGKGALAQCTILELSNNKIGDAGCTALAEAFGKGALPAGSSSWWQFLMVVRVMSSRNRHAKHAALSLSERCVCLRLFFHCQFHV